MQGQPERPYSRERALARTVARLKRRLWWERGAFATVLVGIAGAWCFPVLFPGVWAITVKGRPLVAMGDYQAVRAVVQRVKRSYTGGASEASFNRHVRIARVDPARVEITDAQTAAERLDTTWRQHADQAILYIDGTAVVSLRSQAEAQRVLERAKADLTGQFDQLTGSPTFKEKVEIRLERTTEDILADEETAVALLEGKVDGEGSHVVKTGQSAWSIAREHRLSLSELKRLNPGTNLDRLHIGQQLAVTGKGTPLVTVVADGRKTEELPISYETALLDAPGMYLGKTLQVRPGQPGKARVTSLVRSENGQVVVRKELERQVIETPRPRVIAVGTKARARH